MIIRKSTIAFSIFAAPAVCASVYIFVLTAYYFATQEFDGFLFKMTGGTAVLTALSVCAFVFRHRNVWIKTGFYILGCPYLFLTGLLALIFYLYPNFMDYDWEFPYDHTPELCQKEGGVFRQKFGLFGNYCDLPAAEENNEKVTSK